MSAAPQEPPPIRLGYLVSQYPTVTHTFVLREVRRLSSLGFEIRMVSVRGPDREPTGMPPEDREEYSKTTYILPRGWAAIAWENVRHFAAHPGRYVRGAVRAAKLAGPDLRRLVAYAAYWAEAVVAARAFVAAGVTHVHTHFSSTVAQLLPDAAPLTWSGTIHGSGEFVNPAGFNLAEKARGARFLVAISRYGASQIMRDSDPESWSRIEVVPLGVDPSRYAPPDRLARVDGPAELLTVGSLVPVKGQLILLEALARLVGEGRDVRLRFVGDGPLREGLAQRARELALSDRVIFDGWRNQEEVRQRNAAADVFVLSSFAEGVPVVLMEAMALELPCVSTNVAGIPELIRDGCEGLLVAPADAEALAAAVARILDEPAFARALGVAARTRVLSRYDLLANVDRLGGVFRRRLTS